jgi:predicted nucleic acid-binding protein
MSDYWCKANYFDASALVKLVADDQDEELGRERVSRYYWGHIASVYATPYCVTETFSAFKRKFLRRRITEDQYIKYTSEFRRIILGANLRIDDKVSILSPIVTQEAERLIKKYKIDFLDCFQIVTIMHGYFSKLGPNSKSILITADSDLASAARAEGARVWNCTTETAPPGILVEQMAS